MDVRPVDHQLVGPPYVCGADDHAERQQDYQARAQHHLADIQPGARHQLGEGGAGPEAGLGMDGERRRGGGPEPRVGAHALGRSLEAEPDVGQKQETGGQGEHEQAIP